MLTTKLVEERTVTSLRSPLHLLDTLKLTPTDEQAAVMERFMEDEDPLVIAEEENAHLVRAAAVCALWRLLNVPGSCVRVISAKRKLASEFFGFLFELTTKQNRALAEVSQWPRWNVLQVGNEPGHEMRLVSNNPKWLAAEPQTVTTFVILGASSSEPDFCETREVVEGHRHVEGARTITVW